MDNELAAASAADDAAIQVGGKIRAARKSRGLRLRELATQSGLSESLLSKIENDKTTPSLMTLHRIAQGLGTNISWLFSETEKPDATVLRVGERRVIRTDEEMATTENLVPHGEAHLLQGFLVTIDPGGHSRGSRQHLGEEAGYVVEGEFELTVGASTWRLRAGDSFAFHSDKPHAYRNPGRKRAVVVWMNTPPTL